MPTKNTDIELSKYYNITKTGVQEQDQNTRFGWFASVPRLLDVLCTIPLSGITLEVEYTVYKADGTTIVTSVTGSQILTYNTSNQALVTTNNGSRSYTVEIGAVVKTRLRWKYTKALYQSADGVAILKDVMTLDPTSTGFTVVHNPNTNQNLKQPADAWKTGLPANNTYSAWIDVTNVVANAAQPNQSHTAITYTRTLYRKKTAPTVEAISGSQALKLPSGNLSLSASVILNFQCFTFCGATTKRHDTITAADIVNATGVCQLVKAQTEATKSGFVTARGKTVNNAVLGEGQYYVYAYPAYMGKLTGIVADGAAPILNAFGVNGTPREIEITNPYNAKIKYYVYVSSNPKSLAGSKVVFT